MVAYFKQNQPIFLSSRDQISIFLNNWTQWTTFDLRQLEFLFLLSSNGLKTLMKTINHNNSSTSYINRNHFFINRLVNNKLDFWKPEQASFAPGQPPNFTSHIYIFLIVDRWLLWGKLMYGHCGIIKCEKIEKESFHSFILFPFYFSIFFPISHTKGQETQNLLEETDLTIHFNPWSPWTATSQTPWIRSYTPPLATINAYRLMHYKLWIFLALVCLWLCTHHLIQDLHYFSLFYSFDTTFSVLVVLVCSMLFTRGFLTRFWNQILHIPLLSLNNIFLQLHQPSYILSYPLLHFHKVLGSSYFPLQNSNPLSIHNPPSLETVFNPWLEHLLPHLTSHYSLLITYHHLSPLIICVCSDFCLSECIQIHGIYNKISFKIAKTRASTNLNIHSNQLGCLCSSCSSTFDCGNFQAIFGNSMKHNLTSLLLETEGNLLRLVDLDLDLSKIEFCSMKEISIQAIQDDGEFQELFTVFHGLPKLGSVLHVLQSIPQKGNKDILGNLLYSNNQSDSVLWRIPPPRNYIRTHHRWRRYVEVHVCSRFKIIHHPD
ncbi:hypothetical protein VP01_1008g1 [Puccinia sorghi]|uniref:Uncharacterized protein n=1 Tax=Puccinia sorghi TaxID=27349 RepID=A0A0L6VV41_9BASI|nr:hypothetical protein VP01_1008g1 [Puccinia sorghi]